MLRERAWGQRLLANEGNLNYQGNFILAKSGGRIQWMSGSDVALEYLQSATMKITATLEARSFETLPFDADFRSYQSRSFSNDHKMSFQLFFNLSV